MTPTEFWWEFESRLDAKEEVNPSTDWNELRALIEE